MGSRRIKDSEMAGAIIECARPLDFANHPAHIVRRVALELSIPKKPFLLVFSGGVESK
jgi:hypothetical protein